MSKDFKMFATSNCNVKSSVLDSYEKKNGLLVPKSSYISPTILEERQMNVTQMDVFSRLMADKIIFLGSEINEDVSNIMTAQLLYLSSQDPDSDITIYLNTPGGSVHDGLAIYDTMQYIPNDIQTVCTGMAASMGAVLLCAGTNGKRYALPHSRVMIHQPMGGMQGQASDMEISYQQISILKKELYEIMSKHSGQSINKITKDADRDHWMTAEEALKYGMIDDIFNRN